VTQESLQDDAISRREFISRSLKAGAALAAVGAAGYCLHDRNGPAARPADSSFSLPDFSAGGQGGRMAIVTGSDRVKTVNAALSALGGIGAFVKKGDRVVLKVNAAFATSPSLSATTHPQLTAEVARLCLAAGAASVVVTDNPINDPASCFTLSGIEAAARGAGAKVALPRENSFVPYSVPGGKLIVRWPFLAQPLSGVNKIIGIAPVKHHERSGASMAMKNWYGLLGGRRNTFHQDIHNIIMELAMMIRPTLVILDGTTTMMHNGPTGGSLDDLAATNTMIVSTDQVAADAFGVTLLGKTSADLPYIAKAAAAGCGTADWQSLKPIRAEAT
jgi:uncharacterized protein (DUF362 family)